MSSSAEPLNGTQSSGSGNVARMIDRLSKDVTSLQTAPKKPPKPNNNNNRTAHVRFSYIAQQEDELTMEEDDLIEVIEDVEDGWARGRLKDKIGLFPTNFVSFSTTSTTNLTSFATSRINNDEVRKRSRDEPQQSNGKAQAERTTSSEPNVLPSSFKASVRKSTSGTPAPSTSNSTVKSTSPKEVAKVLYDYKSTQPDELELREGDLITVLTRKCADEGWCEGELNGRRGLFPENFVKFTTITPPSSINQSAPPPTRMSSSTTAGTVVVPPPILPAKPLKSTCKQSTNETTTPSPTVTTSSISATAITTTNTTATPSSTTPAAITASPPVTNQHTTLEERKSMIAGLQSKLFPQGRMPPHKPTYQPPANVFSHSLSGAGDQPSNELGNGGPSGAPIVHIRHSVVDPTKLPNASARDSEPPTSDDSDEPRQLESLTKFRPKQPGKRPPSSHIRHSRMPNGRDELPTTPPLTPPATIAPNPPVQPLAQPETVAVSTGPATTSFPAAEARTPPTSASQQPSPNAATTSSTREIARELTAIGTAVVSKTSSSPTGTTMGQRASRNHSAGSTHSNSQFYTGAKLSDAESPASELISRGEFEEFRVEVFKRLARLEEQLLKKEATEPSELHHL